MFINRRIKRLISFICIFFLLTSIVHASWSESDFGLINTSNEMVDKQSEEPNLEVIDSDKTSDNSILDIRNIQGNKLNNSKESAPSISGYAPKIKLDKKMKKEQLKSVTEIVYGDQSTVTESVYGIKAAAVSATPSLTVTSFTSTSVTINATFPTSGSWGNVIEIWNLNVAQPVLKSSFNPYQGNYYRTNGTYTISGLIPGGVYIIWEYWSTDGEWTGGDNAICRIVHLKYATSETVTRRDGTYIFSNYENGDMNLATATNYNTWLSRMDSAYLSLKDLVGRAPYSGSKIEIKSYRDGFIENVVEGENYWEITWAFAGNPAKFWQPFVKSHMMRLSGGDWGEAAIHELSHDFDNDAWLFDPEFFADLKAYYVVETLGAKVYRIDTEKYYTGSGFSNFFKTDQYWSYDNTLRYGYYSSRGLVSTFIRIKNTIGWQPFKDTFRYLSGLSSGQIPTTEIEKFNMFLAKLCEYSGRDVKALFNSTEIDTIQAFFGGIIPEYNNAIITSNTIPSLMTPGKIYPVSITVKNTGLSTWSAANGYKLGAVGDSDPFTTNRQVLAAGDKIQNNQTKTFSFNMTAPQTIGNYITDWSMVKDTGIWFGEKISKTVEVKNMPDLVVTDLTWSPQNPKAGDLITFYATIKNNGSIASPSGHYIDFSISGNSVGTPRGTCSTIINPGSTATVVSATTWTATIGSHTVTAKVDSTNIINESNENNNTYSKDISFKPDLIVTSIKNVSQSPAITYGNTKFEIKVKNIGNANHVYISKGSIIRTELYANGSSVFSNSALSSIAIGQEVTINALWKPTIAGDYTISAKVDTGNACSEISESNNGYTYPTIINVSIDDNESSNNTMAGATALPLDQSNSSKISAAADLADYYKITVPDPNESSYLKVQLGMPALPGGGILEPAIDYDLELLNSSGSVLSMDISSYYYNTVEYKLTSGSTFYLRVFPHTKNQFYETGFYSIIASVEPTEDGDYNFGGEEYGWDYLGSALDVHSSSIPVYYDTSMNDEWSSGTKFSELMDGGVNIWNSVNLRVPSSSTPIFDKVSTKPSGTCITAKKIYDANSSFVAFYKGGDHSVTLNQYYMTSDFTLPGLTTIQSQFAVVAHELGHALGLEDLYVDGGYTINGTTIRNGDKLMFGFSRQRLANNKFGDNSLRYLHDKDIEGIREIQNWVNRYTKGGLSNTEIIRLDDYPNKKIEYAIASYRYVDEEELYNSSDIIVKGKVKKVADIILTSNSNYSEVTLEVAKYYTNNTGTTENEVKFLQEGDKKLQFKENMLLREGDECILFLRRSEWGDLVITGGPQGRFDILNSREKISLNGGGNILLAENHLSKYIREKVESKGYTYAKTQKDIREFESSIEKALKNNYRKK